MRKAAMGKSLKKEWIDLTYGTWSPKMTRQEAIWKTRQIRMDLKTDNNEMLVDCLIVLGLLNVTDIPADRDDLRPAIKNEKI